MNYIQGDVASFKSPKVQLDSKVRENLTVKRVLMKEPVKEEPNQRRSLLRINCKMASKLCKVVIDFGSTNNIISDEAVERLKLSRIPHSNPYKGTWLNKG